MGRQTVPKCTLLLATVSLVSVYLVARVSYFSHIDRFKPRRASTAASSTPAAAEAETARYVSLCAARMNGNHRNWNHLFMLAAMLHTAERTGRQVIMKPNGWCLDDAFDIDVARFNASVGVPKPVRDLHPPGVYNPDPLLDDVAQLKAMNETTLGLCGLYQTWVYPDAVAATLRRTILFKQDARTDADRFLELCQPTGWPSGSYFRVGIHVRRGDFLSAGEAAWGLSVITEQYLNNSMRYFMSRHDRVQFIVATDDVRWTMNAFVGVFGVDNSTTVDDTLELYRQLIVVANSTVVSFSIGHTTAADLAILAACDATIVSTGSFGWWAAWLANKTTVYYDRWPRRGTTFARQLNRKTYFSPSWIAMT